MELRIEKKRKCPECGEYRRLAGQMFARLTDGSFVDVYKCKECGKLFGVEFSDCELRSR